MKDVVIIGTGGFSKEALWLLENINRGYHCLNFRGFVSNKPEKDIYLFGDDEFLSNYKNEIYAICAVANPILRKKIINKFSNNKNIKFGTFIDPSAKISEHAQIGEGVIIFANCIISVDAVIGDYAFINFSSNIGHDSKIGSFSTIFTNVTVSGGVEIGDFSLIGTGASILPSVKVKKNSVVSIGSVVMRDIEENSTVMGNPARVIREREPLS